MVNLRICMFCALVACGSLVVKGESFQLGKPKISRQGNRNDDQDFDGRGVNVPVCEWKAASEAETGHGKRVDIRSPHFSGTGFRQPAGSITQRKRRSWPDRRQKLATKRMLSADSNSAMKRADCEDHHKLPHDVLNKCLQAKKEKLKAQDIKTKHGALAKPPAKNGAPKGCGEPATKNTSKAP